MVHSICLAACGILLAAAPAAATNASAGPEGSDRACDVQRSRTESEPQTSWHERLSEWLRSHQRPADGIGRAGYYLRSPLLSAFPSEQAARCEAHEKEKAAPRAPQPCVSRTPEPDLSIAPHPPATCPAG